MDYIVRRWVNRLPPWAFELTGAVAPLYAFREDGEGRYPRGWVRQIFYRRATGPEAAALDRVYAAMRVGARGF